MSDLQTKLISFKEQVDGTAITQTHNEKTGEEIEEPCRSIVKSSSMLKTNSDSSGEESGNVEKPERENTTLSLEIVKEQKRRKKTIVGSFRLAELIPTSNTPFTNYRRKSTSVLNAELVVDQRATHHFREGSKLAEESDHERAISAFSKAISLRPDEISYYTARAESYLQLSDFQSAILNYKKACILDPDNDNYYSRLAFIYFFQGQCLFDLKLYNEALESYSRAAEMKPDVVGYHHRSLACLAALQRHGECLALVNKRLEEETNNSDLYIMRARLHELFRNLTLCYYDVKDALLLDPDKAEAKSLLADLEKRANDARQQAVEMNLLGRLKEALTKISIAIETNPSVAEFHLERGALHRRNFDFNAAIDDYLLAMDKADHDEESSTCKEAQKQLLLCYNDFAVECFSKGYYEEAVVLLNKAVKGEKKEKGLYINRGDCFFMLNELHFALADYQQALDMDPGDWAVKSRLSVVYNEFGILEYYDRHYLEAIDHLTTAIICNPKIGQYYVSRARARYMIEDLDGAKSDVLMSLYLNPNNSEVISIFTRLFSGRTVNDVMNSHLGTAAAREVEAALREAFGTHLRPFANQAETNGKESPSKLNEKSVLPPIKGTVFVELMACMEEKDFHINIIRNKKKVNKTVRKALELRQDLRYKGPRVQSRVQPSVPAPGKKKEGPFRFPSRVAPKSENRTPKITVGNSAL